MPETPGLKSTRRLSELWRVHKLQCQLCILSRRRLGTLQRWRNQGSKRIVSLATCPNWTDRHGVAGVETGVQSAVVNNTPTDPNLFTALDLQGVGPHPALLGKVEPKTIMECCQTLDEEYGLPLGKREVGINRERLLMESRVRKGGRRQGGPRHELS